MVDLSIDTFKSKMRKGGARPNLFQAIVNFPSFAGGDVEETSYMIKAASFPASVTEAAEVFFRGRVVPLEGDRTYAPVTLTFYNDVDHPIREAFLKWKNEMSEHSGNRGLSDPTQYMTDLVVQQLDKSGNVTVTNDFVGAWPLNVGEIELDSETMNTVEIFTVEFRFVYWKQDGVTR